MVRNGVSGKVYIGQTTKTLGLRWTWHKSQASRSKTIFGCALLGYGPAAFTVLELGRAFSAEELNEMERRAIWSHSSDDREFGYNMEPGGVGCGTVSIETRKKLSARALGRPHSAQHRANIGKAHKGRKVSPETREKISKTLAGRKRPPFSLETRAKMSKASARRKRSPSPFRGVKRSPETIEKMSRPRSLEFRAKMVEVAKLRWQKKREATTSLTETHP